MSAMLDGAFWFDALGDIDTFDDIDPQIYSGPLDTAPIESGTSSEGGRPKRAARLTSEEKNEKKREIQARYRARQRAKRSDLEAAHAATSAELATTRDEHANASYLNGIMETLLGVRTEALHTLALGNHASKAISIKEKMPAPSLGHQWSETQQPTRTEVPRAIGSSFAIDSRLIGIQDLVSLTELEASVEASVKNQSPEEFVEEWRQLAYALRREIYEYEQQQQQQQRVKACSSTQQGRTPGDARAIVGRADNGSVEAAPVEGDVAVGVSRAHVPTTEEIALQMRLIPLLQSKMARMRVAMRCNLKAVHSLFGTVEEVEHEDYCRDNPLRFWEDTLDYVDLTQEQRQEMSSLFPQYLKRMAAIRAQRAELIENMPKVGDGFIKFDDLGSLQSTMEQYVALFNGAQSLAVHADEALMSTLEYVRQAGRTWTLLQKAKLIARCCPAYPDIFQLMRITASRG